MRYSFEDRKKSMRNAIVYLETARLHFFKCNLVDMKGVPKKFEELMQELKKMDREMKE